MLYRHPQFQFVIKRSWAIRKQWLEREGFFKRLARSGGVVLFICTLAALNVFLFPKAHASYTYNASDNLGQTHGSVTTPNYTDSNDNDTPPANHVGLDGNNGMALDTANHRLFVADEANSRVLVYNLDANNHFTSNSANFAIGQAGFAGDILGHTNSCVYFGQFGEPMPSQNQLCEPDSVAYDSVHNRLFVGDMGWDRVLTFDLSGGISNNMNASFVLGQPDFTSATSSTNCINSPTQSNLCFGFNGGSGSGLAYDSANQRLFVGESYRNRIMVFDVNTGTIANGENASNVLGQPNFTSNSQNVTQNGLSSAGALEYDSANQRLFAADIQRVMVYNLSGGISNGMNAANVLGQPNFTTSGCAGSPTQSSICGPAGFFYDTASSKLYVSDSGGSRALIFNLSGGISNNMNAANEFGQANFTSTSFVAAQNRLADPTGLVYDSVNQQLIVDDTGNARIITYDLSGSISNGMNASHEQGQVDYLGNSSYTLRANDNSNPNPHGFGGSGSTFSQAVSEDPVHHRLYVTDAGNERILVYNLDSSNHLTSHTANYVLGEPDFLSSSPPSCATANAICEPVSVEADPANNRLFVGDYTQSRVLVYDFSGGISNNMNASFVLGQPNFTTIGENCNGLAAQNNFCDVIGLGYDPNHNLLYVAEEGGSRVLVFNVNPGTMSNGENASNVLGQPNYTSEACTYNTPTSICSPENLSYDATDNWLFVTEDDSNRILVFDMSGGVSNNMNASWAIGQPNLTTTTQHCGNGATRAGVCQPFGRVSYDPATKRLFVPDTGNDRVLEYDTSGGLSSGMNAQYVIGLADSQDFTHDGIGNGGGNPVYAQNSVVGPDGTTYDSATGKLYVGDLYNDRLMVFDIGPIITTSSLPDGIRNDPYSQTVSVQDAPGPVTFTISSGSLPPGLNIDSATGIISGTPTTLGLYNFTVQVTDQANESTSQALSIHITGVPVAYQASDLLGQVDGSDQPIWNQSGEFNNTNNPNDNGFGYPSGTAIDTVHHRLFVAEDDFYRVLVFNLDSNNNLIDHTADNVIGQPDFTSSNSNCGTGVATQDSGCYQYLGIAYNPTTNQLFVNDSGNSRVLEYDLSGGITNGMNATHVLGQPDFTTANSSLTNQSSMSFPEGLAIDTVNNRLFVADDGNTRVLVYNLSGGITDGMNASHVLGQPDFSTADSGTTQNQFNDPEDIVFNSTTQQLFVGDSNNYRVLEFDASPGNISDGMNASHVLGQPDFTSKNANTSQDGLEQYQEGLAVDTVTNRLFVADEGNNRVMIYDLAGGISDGMNASGVLGQAVFTTNTSDTSQSGIDDPEGAMAYDPANKRLYVTDSSNSRVMIYDFARLATPAPAGTVGSAYNFNTNSHSQGTTTFSLTSGSLPTGLNLDASTGLISGTPSAAGIYNFSLNLSDDNGTAGIFVDDQSYSVTINSGAPDTTPPSVPTNVHVTGTTTTSVLLAWDASTDNVGVTGYHVFRDGVQVGAPAGTSFTDTGLTPSTTYQYTVSAFDAAANESAQSSPPVPGTTSSSPDTTPPSTPTGLQVTGTTTTSISLSWTASTDNVGVTGYNIYRDGLQVGTTAGTTFTSSGLSPSTTYQFTVSAFDAASNDSGQSSPPVPGTTDAVSNGGGGSTSSPPVSSKSSAPTTPPSSVPIDLDNLPAVASGSVCKDVSEASAGQLYTFTTHDGTDHRVTILQVGADSIEVQIDNLPRTLRVGDLISQDVNGDGVPDICIDVVSITNGKVELKIDRIIFAIAPGGQTKNNGVGAGGQPNLAKPQGFWFGLLHHIPKVVLFVFPWLLFILLGSSVARLSYLSFQERKYAGKLNEQLAREKALSEQKNNFVTLASHYLRTPATTISTGIELVASLNGNPQAAGELKDLSTQLNSGVNNLLAQAEHRTPAETAAPTAGMVLQAPLQALSAGFIQLSSLRAITIALMGAFGLIGVTDYILQHVDLYNVGLVHFLEQLAALLLLGVMLYASLRSYRKRKDLRQQAEKLLASQRELDTARNTLIKNSLDNLQPALRELKAKFQNLRLANPQIAKPALDGVAQLEGLLTKFTIVTSLEAGRMSKALQPLELNQLVGNSIARYTGAIQSKFLNVKNEVASATLNQDPLLLSFVIDSLLSNAIKYSPNNGEIRIEGHQSGKAAQISVQDSGPGIDQAKQAQLFEPFSRVENAAQDFNTQGAGLSLYLDKLVMEYLGGGIGIESEPGNGTSAKVVIPA